MSAAVANPPDPAAAPTAAAPLAPSAPRLQFAERSPFGRAIAAGYLLATATVSVAFAILVVGTHVSDLAAHPLPDCTGRISHDWATHQLVTAVDWAPASPLATRLSGGANAHAAHHLFPQFAHRHGAALSQIVAACARAHGLAHHVTSFAGMVRGQCRLIAALARPKT